MTSHTAKDLTAKTAADEVEVEQEKRMIRERKAQKAADKAAAKAAKQESSKFK